jgi:hypothetical protein
MDSPGSWLPKLLYTCCENTSEPHNS